MLFSKSSEKVMRFNLDDEEEEEKVRVLDVDTKKTFCKTTTFQNRSIFSFGAITGHNSTSNESSRERKSTTY